MKRAVVVLCVVLMLALSSFAYGQWEGQSPCTTWLSPGFKTTFYAGALVDPSDGLAIGEALRFAGSGNFNFVWNVPFRGVWLGLSAESALTNNNIGVMASGWVLVPSSKTSGSVISDLGTITSGYSLEDQFSIVDGAVYFNTWASTKVLAGFRWDHLDTKLTEDLSALSFVERWDFTINAYLPYFGVQVDQGGIVVRVIGFPAVPGDVRLARTNTDGLSIESKSASFKSGQFLEVFASYNKKLSRGMEIGGFLTYNYLHGQTKFITPAEVAIPIEALSVTYNRRYWTMGGSLSWDFNL